MHHFITRTASATAALISRALPTSTVRVHAITRVAMGTSATHALPTVLPVSIAKAAAVRVRDHVLVARMLLQILRIQVKDQSI